MKSKIYLLLVVLLSIGCSGGDKPKVDPPKVEHSFTGGMYAGVFYITEATGLYSDYSNGHTSLMIVVTDKLNGMWGLCVGLDCFDASVENNVLTATSTETDTYISEGKDCEYTNSNSFTLMPVDDNKIDGWNSAGYTDCNSDLESTVEIYMLGVNINIFY